jgi:parallel beta-helix repeat protein
MLTILLVSMFVFSANVQRARANGTIYIRADGSVDPSTAPIATNDSVTYRFTAEVDDSVVVERNNIIIDGGGHAVEGSQVGNGITLEGRNNVTIKNTMIENFSSLSYFEGSGIYLSNSSNINVTQNRITNNRYGITLESSSNDTLSGNDVNSNSYEGIRFEYSFNNVLSDNNVSNNGYGIGLSDSSNNNVLSGNKVNANSYEGIWLDGSTDNTVSGNDVADNSIGIWLYDSSSDNVIFHNSFMNNTAQFSTDTSNNTWDNGYPSGGNYWSDYTGPDVDADGIGDIPYVISTQNRDNYPLMGMFSNFEVATGQSVQVISNSTVSDFYFNNTAIAFKVSGSGSTGCFCRMTIPMSLMAGPYSVTVDGEPAVAVELPFSNSTVSYLYFTYTQSTGDIVVMPEILYLYDDLLTKYQKLTDDFTNLNSSYYQYLQGYEELLKANYNSLNASLSQLQSKQEASENTIANLEYVIYALGALIVILAAVIVYKSVRKPRTRP